MAGKHGAGAAKVAQERYGAKAGQGIGYSRGRFQGISVEAKSIAADISANAGLLIVALKTRKDQV